MPAERAGDYAQAMMDLGATVCTPRGPRCVICPLMTGCSWARGGIAEELPRRAPKTDKADAARDLPSCCSNRDGAILLRKRPVKGLRAGMDEVPSSPWREGKLVGRRGDASEAPVPARWQILDGLVRHTFTHFHLELTVARATATTGGLARLAPGHELVHRGPHDRTGAADGDAKGDRARGEELTVRVRWCALRRQ